MFFILLVLFLFLLTWEVKFTKTELAKFYGIGKTTLGKWVHHLCPESFANGWNKLRKLSAFEYVALLFIFGDPEETQTMNKEQIAQACESDTKTLRREILSKLDKLGLSKEAYDNLSVFPPFMSASLVAAM